MILKTEYQKRMETPCLPPKQHERNSFCYWVNQRDADGRETSYTEIWQWQPNAKSWCRPGYVATGQNEQLLGYEIVALCPSPLSVSETTEMLNLFKDILLRFKVDKVEITLNEFQLIHNNVFHHMSMEHVVKPEEKTVVQVEQEPNVISKESIFKDICLLVFKECSIKDLKLTDVVFKKLSKNEVAFLIFSLEEDIWPGSVLTFDIKDDDTFQHFVDNIHKILNKNLGDL